MQIFTDNTFTIRAHSRFLWFVFVLNIVFFLRVSPNLEIFIEPPVHFYLYEHKNIDEKANEIISGGKCLAWKAVDVRIYWHLARNMSCIALRKAIPKWWPVYWKSLLVFLSWLWPWNTNSRAKHEYSSFCATVFHCLPNIQLNFAVLYSKQTHANNIIVSKMKRTLNSISVSYTYCGKLNVPTMYSFAWIFLKNLVSFRWN